MENGIFEIAEFITKDNVGMLTSLVIGTPLVLIFVQATKKLVDSFFKSIAKLPFIGAIVKKPIKTTTYTFFVCLLYVMYILDSIHGYGLDKDFIFYTCVNTSLLLVCTKGGFDFAFKGIKITKANEENK